MLEATGLYSLDVARVLQATPAVEVMIVNPRASKEFAGAWGQRARSAGRTGSDCTTSPRALGLRMQIRRGWQSWSVSVSSRPGTG